MASRRKRHYHRDVVFRFTFRCYGRSASTFLPPLRSHWAWFPVVIVTTSALNVPPTDCCKQPDLAIIVGPLRGIRGPPFTRKLSDRFGRIEITLKLRTVHSSLVAHHPFC